MKTHNKQLYLKRRKDAYLLLDPILKSTNPFEHHPQDHLFEQSKINALLESGVQIHPRSRIVNGL
jgi:hypothetical protein